MTRAGLGFDDPAWTGLRGGYRVPYDPRPALRALECGDSPGRAGAELWQELYHQGDVAEASYAAVPHLVRIHEARGVPEENTYSLVATIEDARRHGTNPDLPTYLQHDYWKAWRRIVGIGLVEFAHTEDPTLVSSIIAVFAIAKGQLALGRFAARFGEPERAGILHAAGWE